MIGVLSDSHDHIEHIKKVVDLFSKNNVSFIIHAGDVCSPFVWPFFQNLHVPIKCVLGNNVGDITRQHVHAKRFNLDIQFDPFFIEFEHAGKSFAVYHGDPYRLVDALAKTQAYDVLVYGHSHIPKIHQEGKTLLINPGSLVTKIDFELSVLRGENNPGPSVALYDPKTHKSQLVFL